MLVRRTVCLANIKNKKEVDKMKGLNINKILTGAIITVAGLLLYDYVIKKYIIKGV